MNRIALATLLGLVALLSAPTAQAAPVPVFVDLHVISLGNYDANKGTYVLDFYLHFWYDAAAAPPGFTPQGFEFMNGRAASKELLSDEVDAEGVRHVWYRIQANLYSDPSFLSYPYGRQQIRVAIEDSALDASRLVYVAQLSGSGLDDDFRVAGWNVEGSTVTVAANEYGFGETYSRFVLNVAIAREPLSATLRTFLPPLAFVAVAAAGMVLHPSKLATRLAVGGSMLVSAVGFHISQTVSLPTLGRLTLFDCVMLACYVFLAGNLAVGTLVAYNEDVRKKPELTVRLNRRGNAACAAVGLAAFVLLRAL